MARRVYNPVGAKVVKPSPPTLPASMKPSASAIRIANAFDVLGKDTSDVQRLVTIVDAKADAAFLSREKTRKEEAKAAERRRDAFPSHHPPSSRRIPPREFQRRSNFLEDQGNGQGGRVPVAGKQWVPKSQSQSQNGDGNVKAAASQQWVPKSQSQSQNGDGNVKAIASPSASDQIQGSHAKEAKNQIQGNYRGYDNYDGQYQQRRGGGRGRGGYQNQGTRRYPDQSDRNNRQELEKQTQGGGAVNVEVVDEKKQVNG